MTPESIIDEVKKSSLRGRGGAGFPTGMKWSFVPKHNPKPKYVLCNADESEPGTSKDRPLMEMDPHQLIEGCIIAGRAIGSNQGYIYIRGEYRYVIDIMERRIAEAYKRGYLGKNIMGSGFDFELVTHTGAGAYECGEESALMESLEGKRGYPRIKPPFPAVVGLYGCPTVINNAETLSHSAGNYSQRAAIGTPAWHAEKRRHAALFCISGHVNKPGIYELPLGFPLRKLIEDVAGGMLNGKKLKAVIPGGSSCPLLTRRRNRCEPWTTIPSPRSARCWVRAASSCSTKTPAWSIWRGASCISTRTNPAAGASPAAKARAGCARCWTASTTAADARKIFRWSTSLAKNMLGRTFCPLGDAAAMPTISIVKKWRTNLKNIFHGKCRV